jgi:hypothetical protein
VPSDLGIVFLLLYKEHDGFAFGGNFSYSNGYYFQLVFSHVMIIGSLLFFDANFHQKHFQYLQGIAIPMLLFDNGKKSNRTYYYKTKAFIKLLFFFN